MPAAHPRTGPWPVHAVTARARPRNIDVIDHPERTSFRCRNTLGGKGLIASPLTASSRNVRCLFPDARRSSVRLAPQGGGKRCCFARFSRAFGRHSRPFGRTKAAPGIEGTRVSGAPSRRRSPQGPTLREWGGLPSTGIHEPRSGPVRAPRIPARFVARWLRPDRSGACRWTDGETR